MNGETIIKTYLDRAGICASLLKAKAQGMHPVTAWRSKKLPARGKIQANEEIEYTMHGIGCQFSTHLWSIDVEFNAEGECGGFDAWRIWQFEKSKQNPMHLALPDIRVVLNELAKSGLIRKASPPCSHLFQLVE